MPPKASKRFNFNVTDNRENKDGRNRDWNNNWQRDKSKSQQNSNKPNSGTNTNKTNQTSGTGSVTNFPFRQRQGEFRSRYGYANKFVNQPRIGLKHIQELLEKTPEQIILSFRDPKFRIEDYLNSPTMGDALVIKLAIVLNKAFECNSIQVMVRNQIEKIVESIYFKKHLYDTIYRVNPITNQYNLDLIETTIQLCAKFLLLQPLSQEQLSPMKDRIELLVTNRLSNPNPKLTEIFKEMIRLDQEATNRFIFRHYNFHI